MWEIGRVVWAWSYGLKEAGWLGSVDLEWNRGLRRVGCGGENAKEIEVRRVVGGWLVVRCDGI